MISLSAQGVTEMVE
jgi:hypothetical protein